MTLDLDSSLLCIAILNLKNIDDCLTVEWDSRKAHDIRTMLPYLSQIVLDFENVIVVVALEHAHLSDVSLDL
jgi:hypothetical protein